jgi:hypothetical protein
MSWYDEDPEDTYDPEVDSDEGYYDEDEENDGLDSLSSEPFPDSRATVLKTEADDFVCFPTTDPKTGKPSYFGLSFNKGRPKVLEEMRWNERKILAAERERGIENWDANKQASFGADQTNRGDVEPKGTTWEEVFND